MITYEDFVPGRLMGYSEFVLDANLVSSWCRLFPDDDIGGLMPHGMVAVIAMRAYGDVVQPRPPGNVHAAQRFEVSRLPRVGERLRTAVTCLEKEIRRDRRRVTLATETDGEAGPAFHGRMTILWAK